MGQGQDDRGRRLTTCLSAATLQQPGFSGFLFFFFFFIFFFFFFFSSSSFLLLFFFFFCPQRFRFRLLLFALDSGWIFWKRSKPIPAGGGAFFLPSAVRPSSLSVRPSVVFADVFLRRRSVDGVRRGVGTGVPVLV